MPDGSFGWWLRKLEIWTGMEFSIPYNLHFIAYEWRRTCCFKLNTRYWWHSRINNYWNFRWLQLRHTQGDSSQLDNQKWIWSSKLRHVATWQNVQVKKQSGNLAKILPGPSKLASFTTSLSFFYFVEICLSVFVLRWKKIKSFKDVPVRRTVQPHPTPHPPL